MRNPVRIVIEFDRPTTATSADIAAVQKAAQEAAAAALEKRSRQQAKLARWSARWGRQPGQEDGPGEQPTCATLPAKAAEPAQERR